jgi:putative redox protein
VGVRLKWDGDLRFVAENENGVAVPMDTGPKYGGSGKHPTPMELVAMALGGCTGMDIASILKKMRVDLKKFEIEVQTTRRSEDPAYYEAIHIVYTVSGDGLTEEKAQRAANLSNQKYCSVGVMLREKAKITYDVIVEP